MVAPHPHAQRHHRRSNDRGFPAAALVCAVLCLLVHSAASGRATWSVLEPEYTDEELAEINGAAGAASQPPEERVYSLGFRMEDLVQEATSLRAQDAPLRSNDSFSGSNWTAAAPPQYFADRPQEDNVTATSNGGAEGLQAEAHAWKYWEQPSDGSEFMCRFNTSGQAEVVTWGDDNKQPSAQDCAKSCRANKRCNAWYWCKDAERKSCFDMQSQTWLQHRGCKLLHMPVLPVEPPQPSDRAHISDSAYYRSFAVGYVKRELYVRPPNVVMATAVARCARGDWEVEEHQWANHLTWVSVYNKMDYARLHGTTLHVTFLYDLKTKKVDLVNRLLKEEQGNTDAQWILWTDVRAMISNAAFAFPLIKEYEAAGAELVLFGSREGVMSGDSWKHDTGVLLIKNTPWARGFFKQAQAVMRKPAVMKPLIGHDLFLHGSRNATLEQVIMYLLMKDEATNLPRVHFERTFCLACFWKKHNLRAPTSYISHFSAVPCCGEFSLQLDDSYHESLMQHANISRCNFMKALHRSAPLEVAHGPNPFRYRSTRLLDFMLVPGSKNLQPTAAGCRASCASNPRCTAWLWCARAGGCDDGKNMAPKTWPQHACALLDTPWWSPLEEAARGPSFSSFAIGFMHDYSVPSEKDEDDLFPASHRAIGDGDVEGGSKTRRRRGRRKTNAAASGVTQLKERAEAAAGTNSAAAAGFSEGWSLSSLLWGRWRVPTERRLPPRDKPNVAIITAVPPNPCSFPIADHFNAIGVMNKQDYARRHGWEVHLSAENVDPTAVGNFNKMAFIKHMLAVTPREDAEWIWWTDADTLITDMAFEFPFHRYQDYDLVVWGQRERIETGELEGINCGVMMFRNNDWSRAFLEELSGYAHLGEEALLEMRPILEKEVWPLVKGFKDTPFIVYMLKTQAKYLDRVYFEQEVGFNRHWLQVDWASGEVPLLAHYAGCTVCNPPEGKLSEEVIRGCNDEYAKAYAFGRCNLAAAYTNVSAPAVCNYPAADLSNLTIRLGS